MLNERARAYGIRIFPPFGSGHAEWRVTSVYSDEAAATGLRPGDLLLAINGQAITNSTTRATVGLALGDREGASVTLVTQSVGGAAEARVLTYRAHNLETWYRGSGLNVWREFMLRRIVYDLMTALLVAVSAILFLRRSHEPVAAAFALGLCLIPLGPTIEFWVSIDALKVYQFLSAIPFIALLMVGCAFPDGRYWPPWTRFSLVAVPLISLPLMLLANDYGSFTLYAAPAFLVTIAILSLRYRRLPQGAERQQFRWAALGLAAGVVLLILRLPAAWVQAGLDPGPLSPWIDLSASFLHALGFAVIGAGFGVALLKYKLYDADLLISRSAVIAAATVLLAALWATSEKAFETFLPDLVGPEYASIAGIFGAGLAVVLVTFAHGRMQHFIEKRFHKGVYRLREELPKVLDTLTLRFGMGDLCARVLDDIARDVRVAKAAIVLRDAESVNVAARHGADAAELQSWIETRGEPSEAAPSVFSVSLPLIDPVMNEDIGWLLVGSRPDGSICNRDERAALAAVAPQIARSIATVRAMDRRMAL